jgi:hypothetical protein
MTDKSWTSYQVFRVPLYETQSPNNMCEVAAWRGLRLSGGVLSESRGPSKGRDTMTGHHLYTRGCIKYADVIAIMQICETYV